MVPQRYATLKERLRTAQAHADVTKDEDTILTAELAPALQSGRERTGVFLARTLLLAGTLCRIQRLGVLRHAKQIRPPGTPCNESDVST